MKPRSDSRLFRLTPDQQAQLYGWIRDLGYTKALARVAQPPPEGFGLKTHLNSLCRFVARYSEMLKEREFFDILRCASGEIDPGVLRATEACAHQMAFDIATSPRQDLDSFRLLSRWVLRLKEEKLRREWAQLAREQSDFALERLASSVTQQVPSHPPGGIKSPAE